MSRTPQQIDIYQIVTDQIICYLEKGIIPWRRSWADAGEPMNLISRRKYRGINALLLNTLDYEINLFLTFKQLTAIGGSVKKGEKSHMVVYWDAKEFENEQREKVQAYLINYLKVFNVTQCENIPVGLYPPGIANDPLVSCERIVDGMPNKPKVFHRKGEPFYHTKEDFINMPRLKSYEGFEDYYLDLFHELIHSTGHESRLNREELMQPAEFGTIEYMMEELISEIGASFLKSHAGILKDSVNEKNEYIQRWLELLRQDKWFIFYACSQAQRAVEYILGDGAKEKRTEISKAQAIA